MQAARIPVDVIMERVPLHNRWATERWQPVAVTPAADGTGQTSCARLAGDPERWRCGPFEVELHPTEAEGYYLNLTAPAPKAFVMWRMFEPVGQRNAVDLLAGVPLPDGLGDVMQPFIATHYKPEPRRKVKRNDPVGDAGGRRRDR